MSILIEELPPREGSQARRFSYQFGAYAGTVAVNPKWPEIITPVAFGGNTPRPLSLLKDAVQDYLRQHPMAV